MKNKYYVDAANKWFTSIMVITNGEKQRSLDKKENLFRDNINFVPEFWRELTYSRAKQWLKNWDGRDLDASLRKFKKS